MAKQTKTTKSTEKKPVVKAAPVAQHECGKDCPCGCHKHRIAHLLKHIIVWVIIFALGMVCGRMTNSGHANKKMQQRMHPVFANGCLDKKSISSDKMLKILEKADVNSDECISVEEYRNARKEMWPMNKKNVNKPLNKAQLFKGQMPKPKKTK